MDRYWRCGHEAEAVGGSEVISFNSGAEICALRSQTYSFSNYITLPVVLS
jgi:hypothetical protein